MRKLSLGTAVGLMALTAAAAVSISYQVAIGQTNAKIRDINERQAMFTKLSEVDATVRRTQIDIDETALGDALSRGYLAGISDENALYLDVQDGRSYTEGEMEPTIGIGAEVVPHAKGLRVLCVYEGSGAQASGLKAGNIITAADGMPISEMAYAMAMSRVNRSEGTVVRLELLKAADGGSRTAEVICSKFQPQTAVGEMLEDTAYIRVFRMKSETGKAVQTLAEDLRRQGARRLVLDLRGCGGTSAASAAQIADLLLGEAETVRYSENGAVCVEYTSVEKNLGLPAVCLTDSSTGYAGEVLAAALQGNGVPCFGAATGGFAPRIVFHRLSDGSALLLTEGNYLLADGSFITGNGVYPQQALTFTKEQEQLFAQGLLPARDDPQVAAAIKSMQTP